MVWPLVIPIAPKMQSGSVEQSSAIQDARSSMLLKSAIGNYLTVVGQNYGVPRAPQMNPGDDTLYRKIIPVLAWSPKMIKRTTYALLEAIFGSQASIIEAGNRPWRMFETPKLVYGDINNPINQEQVINAANEVVFEIPAGLIATTNENASYLHGGWGFATNATGSPAASFVYQGNLNDIIDDPLIGYSIWINDPSGSTTWAEYTIQSSTYDSSTNTTTVVIDEGAVIPSGGCRFFIDVPGNNFVSYRGDYIAPSAVAVSFSTAAGGGTTTTLNGVGDLTRELQDDMTISLTYTTDPLHQIYTTDIDGTPTYDPATNVTTIVVTDPFPNGIQGTIFRDEEAADGTSPLTAPHDDRVYLSAFGLYDVFKYYYDLLVRAAGVVVRLEIVADYTHTHKVIP